ncbi:MAG: hypothetical protein CMJ59_18480 [Planctomycetaceae bacterium]|nr:hypothetical protein [Planctomycetaceae bacterium]
MVEQGAANQATGWDGHSGKAGLLGDRIEAQLSTGDRRLRTARDQVRWRADWRAGEFAAPFG